MTFFVTQFELIFGKPVSTFPDHAQRCPKIAEPTRTWVAPNWIAVAKSALMPIDRFFKPVARGDLRGQREMRRRRIVDRRNAHQAGNLQTVFLAAAGNEGVGLAWSDARLLRLLAGVELDEQLRPPFLGIDFLG